jgi:hypothetical protein
MTLTAPAGATRVRVNTLGDAERRVTVPDESNVLLLPTRLVDFPDRVLIDVMQPSIPDVAFGAHFALSETDVLAVWGGARSRLVAGGLALPVAGVREIGGAAAGDAGAAAGVLGDGDVTAPAAGALGGLAGGRAPGAGTATDGATALGGLGALKQAALPAGATLSTVAGLRADLQATVLYAHRFEDWRLGVLVSAWADLDEQTRPATEAYERRTTLVEARIGAGFDLGRRSSIDFALVGGYAAFTDQGYDTATGGSAARIEDDGLWQVGAIVVSRLALWRGGAIVPYGEFLYRDQQLTANTAFESGEGSFQGIRGTVGVDLSIEPTAGVLIQPGLGFVAEQGIVEWADDDTRVKSLVLLLPTYGVGVEAWVLDWLALRLSARQSVRMVTDEWRGLAGDTASRRRRTYDVDTRIAFGLGFRFAGFALDLMLNPDIFTSGPYGVTGNELDSLNLQAALLYQW